MNTGRLFEQIYEAYQHNGGKDLYEASQTGK